MHVVSLPPGGEFVAAIQNVVHGAGELSNIDSIVDLIEQSLVKMLLSWSSLNNNYLSTLSVIKHMVEEKAAEFSLAWKR